MNGEGVEVSECVSEARRFTGAGAWLWYGGASLAVVLGYLAMHLVRRQPAFPLDDPYITLHSAQVLHWGFDPNYVGVPALYGVTSAPFLALVYVLLFVLKPLFALDTACWLGVLFYTLGLVRLVRTFRMTNREGLCFLVLGLTVSYVPFNLLNGLETPWAMAGVVWTLALSSGEESQWKWAALVAGMTASIRPDLIPFAACVVCALGWQDYRAHHRLGRTVMQTCSFALLASCAILPCALWYVHSTGVPFPLSGLAKEYFFAGASAAWSRKVNFEVTHLIAYLLTCGPLVVALGGVMRRPMAKALLASIVLFLIAIYYQFPGALFWNYFRYPIVLTPMLLWGAAASLSVSEAEARKRATRFLMFCTAYSLLFFPVCIRSYVQQCRLFDGGLHDLVSWSERTLPANSTLLVHDAGYIAYASHFRIVDMVGLKTPEAIALNRRYSYPNVGAQRGEALSVLARSTNAEYLVATQDWLKIFRFRQQMQALGWGLEPVKIGNPYCVYKLTPPPS